MRDRIIALAITPTQLPFGMHHGTRGRKGKGIYGADSLCFLAPANKHRRSS